MITGPKLYQLIPKTPWAHCEIPTNIVPGQSPEVRVIESRLENKGGETMS